MELRGDVRQIIYQSVRNCSYHRGQKLRPYRLVKQFLRSQDGVFAVVFALMAVPLIALAGAAVDYTRWMSARSSAQEAIDAGVLAAAAARSSTDAEVARAVGAVVEPRLAQWPDISLSEAIYRSDTESVRASVQGSIPTYFVSLVGVSALPVSVSAEALHAADGNVELALVLDNTWSMSAQDESGTRKIDALKSAARSLLNILFRNDTGNVQVGVVPYAEYVNVGLANRHQPWLSIPPDSTTTTPRTCETRTTRQTCTRGEPRTCTRTVDGVSETYDCTPTTCTTYEVPPYEVCSGGGTSTSTWHGCVLSRTQGNLRLSDSDPGVPYVGLTGTSRRCMTEILPLTANLSALRTAIDNMVVNVGSYRPQTYIPAGMIWGVNVLSHPVPFTEGLPYDPANAEPRKAIVLMTDGDNTLRFNQNNGQHVSLSSNSGTAANQKRDTDNDTLAICQYAKQNMIEVFSISFGTIASSSEDMLRSCATSPNHYFSAQNSAELNAAFETIAAQLSVVRLSK